MTRFSLRGYVQMVLASVALLAWSGCAMMDVGSAPSLALPTDGPAAPTVGRGVTLEIREAGKKPEIKQFALENGSTVQQLLEKAKLVRTFRRMDIEVLRVAGDQRAKLAVKYDHTQAQVRPEYDYALYPGDHLIVQEVTKTAFDDMIESVGDPLRRATGGR